MACVNTFAYYFTILSTSTLTHAIFSEQSPLSLSAKRMEKLTRLHFYFHDIRAGQNPTAMPIFVPPKKLSVDGFGTTFMVDDALTEGPKASSRLVGRAQGIYAVASQHDSGLLMVLNFAFRDATYNGSSLSILGRNPFMETIREMPVVGGSGVFRYARGYALAKTVSLSATGTAVVEYNVSVLHY